MKSFFSQNYNKYFELGILFSSLDSFHGFTKIATYAPFLSIIFFFIYLIKTPGKEYLKFSNIGSIAIFIVFCSVLYSFYKGFEHSDFIGFRNYSIQLAICLVCFCSFKAYFISLSRLHPIDYANKFASLFVKYSIPIIIIGIFELLIFWNKGIYNSFVSIFSSRIAPGRLQLISAEPAWASRFLLIFLCLLPLSNLPGKPKRMLTIISLVLLLATGSAYGIICVGLYYMLTYLNQKNLKYYFISGCICIISIPIFLSLTNDYTRNRFELLTELNSSDLESLAVNAGSFSVLARIGNPILGVDMGIANPIFGVGGGYYYYEHPYYLKERYPIAASKFDEAFEDAGSTAKNLFSRICAEFGLSICCIIIIYLFFLYKKQIIHHHWIKGPFIAMLILTFNFDNLYHLYPLILFCFILYSPAKNHPHYIYAIKNQSVDNTASIS